MLSISESTKQGVAPHSVDRLKIWGVLNMNIQFHNAAEIQAVAMEDSLQEPVVQTALATELTSEAVLAPTEYQHATWNRWTTVWKALSHG